MRRPWGARTRLVAMRRPRLSPRARGRGAGGAWLAARALGPLSAALAAAFARRAAALSHSWSALGKMRLDYATGNLGIGSTFMEEDAAELLDVDGDARVRAPRTEREAQTTTRARAAASQAQRGAGARRGAAHARHY